MRMADDEGFEVAMLAGSTASATILGAPDLLLTTLTEVADLVRRLVRATASSGRGIPLLIDADNGFGNAMHVVRCVQELEAAGAAGITIEDSALPAAYGSTGKSIQGSAGAFALTSIEEGVGRLRAAVAGRGDAEFVILARTSAFAVGGIDAVLPRVAAYQRVPGVDGIFLLGNLTKGDWRRVRAVCPTLPIVVGSGWQGHDPAFLTDEAGVGIALAGHAPFLAAQRAALDGLRALRAAGPRAAKAATPVIDGADMRRLTRADDYVSQQRDWIGIEKPHGGRH